MSSYKKMLIPLFITVLCLFSSCTEKEPTYTTRTFFAMNTVVTLSVDTDNSMLIDSAEAELRGIEHLFSRTDADSEISAINAAGNTAVSEQCFEILAQLSEISKNTGGAFNPCMGQIVSLWDITGTQYVPTDAEIESALNNCPADGYTLQAPNVVMRANPSVLLDLGGAVKGYAAEETLKFLQKNGVTNAMVNIGGNVGICGNAHGNPYGWNIGIRNPFYPDELAGQITLSDGIVSVSGIYERGFERDGVRYHHIFDPATGKPAENGIVSTVVIAKDGLLSDALSTALFIMGISDSYALYDSGIYDFEAVLFADDGTVYLTDGLRNSFELYADAAFSPNEKLHLADGH